MWRSRASCLQLAGGHRCVVRRMSLRVGEQHREGLDVGHVEEIGEVALFAAGELHADRRDEHQLGEPRATAHAHLERDPSAERRADQNHVVELQLVEQIEIEVGEIVDRSDVGRSGRRTVAGMPRRDHRPLLRECLEMRPCLLEILLGMQVEERRTRACDMGLNGAAPDIECFHCDRPVQAFYLRWKMPRAKTSARAPAPLAPLAGIAAPFTEHPVRQYR